MRLLYFDSTKRKIIRLCFDVTQCLCYYSQYVAHCYTPLSIFTSRGSNYTNSNISVICETLNLIVDEMKNKYHNLFIATIELLHHHHFISTTNQANIIFKPHKNSP